MRPFAVILKKSLEMRTRGFILSTVVACLSGDVGCGPVQGGRRKVRMREEKGRHHGRRRFSPQPESGSGAGAAGGGGWRKTAPSLHSHLGRGEDASGSPGRARRCRRSIGLPFAVLSPADSFALSFSLSLMKTLEERGFYSKQEGSMIIFPSW